MARLTDDQKQLLSALPDDGTAIGGYSLFARLQELGWRTREIERTMEELRELGAIIVGRGGNGGSVRHVKKDRRALLDAIEELAAEGRNCTRQSLQQYLRWHPDYLEQVLEFLCEAGKVRIGPGGGGGVISLTAADDIEEEPDVVEDPEEDEQRFLALVPLTGSASNSRLRNELSRHHGWDEERYWETRKRLRQKGLIEIGRGRGGSVHRVSIGNVVSANEPPREPERPEPDEIQDEVALMQGLPSSGETVSLSELRQHFSGSDDRFYGALERLHTTQRVIWGNSTVGRLPPSPSPAAPVAGPAPSTSPVEPTAALFGFFRERFDADSLRRFIELHLCAPTVSQSVPWESAFADAAWRLVTVLQREGYIDAELFDKLRGYFPRLHPQINVLSRTWLDRSESA